MDQENRRDGTTNGKTLASGSLDHTIKLWNAQTGRKLARLKGHADSVRSVAFSPNSKEVSSGSEDETVKLCVVDSRK